MKYIKFIIKFIFAIILYFLNLPKILKIINYINKNKIILINDGGFGHVLVDASNLNYLYDQKNKIIFHYINNNFNVLFENCLKNNINIFFVKTFIKIKKYKIYDFNSEKIFKKLFTLSIIFLFKKENIIQSYQELEDLFIDTKNKFNKNQFYNNSYSRNYLGYMLSHKIEIDRFKKIFYFNEKLKFNILNKIPEKYILQKNKCIMFYYRKKKQIDGTRLFEIRDGGPIENYFKGFSYLIEKGYKIYFNGDVDYLYESKKYKLIKQKFSNNIIFNKDINLSIDKFYIYSLFNSKFFIGNGGGGSYFHFHVRIPGLILNLYPYWVTVRNSVLYFKPPKNDLKIDYNFMSKISPKNDEQFDLVRDMNEEEIYKSIKNFEISYSNLNIIKRSSEDKKIYDRLPDFYFLKHDNNSLLSNEFINKFF